MKVTVGDNHFSPVSSGGFFSSVTDEWWTPWPFFQRLDEEFHFDLDCCASPESTKCKLYFTLLDDGLAQKWAGNVWMNPPYGIGMEKWVQKAFESAQQGALVVAFIPVRSDTVLWHEYVMQASEVRFVRRRMRFEGPNNEGAVAPFPSCLVIFRPYCVGPPVMRSWDR